MWNLDTQGRLSAWRNFRETISSLSLYEAVHETNSFWNTATISNPYYTQDIKKDWPNPWQLVADNHYDNLAKGLGICYTIALSRSENCEFRCYNNRKRSANYNLAWIDNGKYVLNFDLSIRVNRELEELTESTLIASYTKEEIINESDSSYKKRWDERAVRFR
jgi:hypothetical protein